MSTPQPVRHLWETVIITNEIETAGSRVSFATTNCAAVHVSCKLKPLEIGCRGLQWRKQPTVQLTQEQHDQLEQTGTLPARILDPANQQEYVLVAADFFARLETLVADAEDQAVQDAWLALSRQQAAAWIRDNPF